MRNGRNFEKKKRKEINFISLLLFCSEQNQPKTGAHRHIFKSQCSSCNPYDEVTIKYRSMLCALFADVVGERFGKGRKSVQ